MTTRRVVFDAGPLIHLHELDCLDLAAGFGEVWVPVEVYEEVIRHRPGFEDDSSEIDLQQIRVRSNESPGFLTLARTLGLDRGEVAALSLMDEMPEALFLTDDAAARMAAKSLGLRAYGTLGIVLRSMRRETRSRVEVLRILRSIPERSTLYLREELLAEIIAEVESA